MKTIGIRIACAFALAMFAAAPSAAQPIAGNDIAVVVGDDGLRVVVQDGSPVPCGPAPYPAPCTYQENSPLAFTNVVATATGATVFGLTQAGGATTIDATARPIAVVLQAQVPQIRADATLVIVALGNADALGATDGLARFDALIAAVRARAPSARLTFLGLRETSSTSAPDAARIAAWNAHERLVARSIGATFVDMLALFPADDYPVFPDGVHPSRLGSIAIANALMAPAGSTAIRATNEAPPPRIRYPATRGAALPPRAKRMTLAVVGASMDREVILDGSPRPCGAIERAAPCRYEDESSFAYPKLVGALVNGSVQTLSLGGSQAADARTGGTIPSALEAQVPKIPLDADIVVTDIGINDTSISGTTEETLSRVDKVVSAIRARVPRAHIVMLGLRDYGASVASRVVAWNAREERVAASVGATYIDIRQAFPATDVADFPDGTHPSAVGSTRLALAIAAAIEHLRGDHP